MDIIDTFATKYKNANSRLAYQETLKDYFKVIKVEPTKAYFKTNKKTIKKHIETYFEYLQTNINTRKNDEGQIIERTNFPTTIKTKISRIRYFLKMNDVILPESIWDTIKRENTGSKKPIIEKGTPTPEQLKDILSYCNTKYKAIFLICSSSGARIGEVVQLKEGNLIHLDNNPPEIYYQADITKTKRARYTFITKECKKAIEKFKPLRDKDFKKSKAIHERTHKGQSYTDKGYLFHVSANTASKYWRNRLRDTNDKELMRRDLSNPQYYVYNEHSTRRYFKNRLRKHMGLAEVEFLMGHDIDKLGYTDFNKNEVAKEYLKHCDRLRVFTTGISDEKIEDIIKGHDDTMEIKNKAIIKHKEAIKNQQEQIEKYKEELNIKDFALSVKEQQSILDGLRMYLLNDELKISQGKKSRINEKYRKMIEEMLKSETEDLKESQKLLKKLQEKKK